MAEPLLIPADAAQRLLAAANGDAALLYLYLFENRPLSGAQTALRMTQARYDLACATLQQLGLWPQEARTHLDASQARSIPSRTSFARRAPAASLKPSPARRSGGWDGSCPMKN